MIHRLLATAARTSGAALRVACAVETVTMTKDLVRDGFGYAVMPYGAVCREVEDGWLAALLIVDPPLTRTLHLTCAFGRDRRSCIRISRASIGAVVGFERGQTARPAAIVDFHEAELVIARVA